MVVAKDELAQSYMAQALIARLWLELFIVFGNEIRFFVLRKYYSGWYIKAVGYNPINPKKLLDQNGIIIDLVYDWHDQK